MCTCKTALTNVLIINLVNTQKSADARQPVWPAAFEESTADDLHKMNDECMRTI